MHDDISSSHRKSGLRAPLGAAVKVFGRYANSALFISVLGSIVLAFLTYIYSARQVNEADLAARKAQLMPLLVELDLRIARLKIASEQLASSDHVSSAGLQKGGARAIAIVDGNPETVTSNPAYKNEHMVSLLSRAEFAAGLPLTNKDYLLTFTDLENCAALQQTAYVTARVQPLIFFLTGQLASDALPLASSDKGSKALPAQIYEKLDARAKIAAEPLDILSSSTAASLKQAGMVSCEK